jgi:hypothetical protein
VESLVLSAGNRRLGSVSFDRGNEGKYFHIFVISYYNKILIPASGSTMQSRYM